MILLFRAGRWVRHHLLPREFAGRRQLRKLYERLARQSRAAGARGVPVSIGRYGPFELDPLMATGRYEEWGSGHNSGLDSWVGACRGKRVVIDIGAHIGLYSLPASQVLAEGGAVYAFEPAEQNARMLAKHLAYNRIANVHVVPHLAGEHDREHAVFFERVDAVDGMNAVLVGKNRHLYSETSRRQVSLDTFCAENRLVPEVIKIDVEGAELRVLRGARRTMRESRPLMFVSVHPGRIEAFDDSLPALSAFLDELGYQAFDNAGNRAQEFRFDEYLFRPVEHMAGVMNVRA